MDWKDAKPVANGRRLLSKCKRSSCWLRLVRNVTLRFGSVSGNGTGTSTPSCSITRSGDGAEPVGWLHLPSSADTATEGVDFTIASLPISFLSCDQPPPLRLNAQAAPIPPLSLDPPTMMTLPSADSATNGADFPTALVPTSFLSSVH